MHIEVIEVCGSRDIDCEDAIFWDIVWSQLGTSRVFSNHMLRVNFYVIPLHPVHLKGSPVV
jgi:hypothetical protein